MKKIIYNFKKVDWIMIVFSTVIMTSIMSIIMIIQHDFNIGWIVCSALVFPFFGLLMVIFPSNVKSIFESLLEEGFFDMEYNNPSPAQRVYVICKTENYKGLVIYYQTMAEYIPHMTIPFDEYMSEEHGGEGYYDEATDENYTPEGFYEWQSVPEINYRLDDEVVMWKPLYNLDVLNKKKAI